MKSNPRIIIACLLGFTLILGLIVFLSPLFLDSKISRLKENDLPRIIIENNNTVYCRMKADDFRFSLPDGAVAMNPILTSGGFDTVEGQVQVRFTHSQAISAKACSSLLHKQLQTGGSIQVSNAPLSSDLIINFSYFGDR